MLADKDRIFLNLYGNHGADLENAKKRGAWNGTAESAESALSAMPWMKHADAVRIGRVIARPFEGEPGAFRRTSRKMP